MQTALAGQIEANSAEVRTGSGTPARPTSRKPSLPKKARVIVVGGRSS
ncbi:MAG TPA: hypothetical protein VFS43_20945 [Polyangiaceae bacterium]|nr:hypothetical protein [Polyangiaceae bacterium]